METKFYFNNSRFKNQFLFLKIAILLILTCLLTFIIFFISSDYFLFDYPRLAFTQKCINFKAEIEPQQYKDVVMKNEVIELSDISTNDVKMFTGGKLNPYYFQSRLENKQLDDLSTNQPVYLTQANIQNLHPEKLDELVEDYIQTNKMSNFRRLVGYCLYSQETTQSTAKLEYELLLQTGGSAYCTNWNEEIQFSLQANGKIYLQKLGSSVIGFECS